MSLLAVIMSTLLLSSGSKIEESPKEIKIAMFTICNRSHLRPMTSIAQELSQNPNVKVTLIINSLCEKLVREQNYNFDIEVVPSSIDQWKNEDITFYTVSKFVAEFEKDVLDIYIPKWKDPKNLPDLIVNDHYTFPGKDLAEIYKITNVVVATSILNLLSVIDEDFYPEYAPMYTPTHVYEPTDNILLRALRYIPKNIVKKLVLYNTNKDSNALRATIGLPPNTS